MKRFFAILLTVLSLLALGSCSGGNSDVGGGDPGCAHKNTTWTVLGSSTTCDRQYNDYTIGVELYCVDCTAYIRCVEIPCTYFTIHQPDENGVCEKCSSSVLSTYLSDTLLPYYTVSWEEDGASYSISIDEDTATYSVKTGETVTENYYKLEGLNEYGNYSSISVRSYKNGYITESYESQHDWDLQDYVYGIRNYLGGTEWKKDGVINHPVVYNAGSETIRFTLPLNTYSIYTNVEGEKQLVASKVAVFDSMYVSYVDERSDSPISCRISYSNKDLDLPEHKAEDDFFLALADLENYAPFGENEFRTVSTETVISSDGSHFESVATIEYGTDAMEISRYQTESSLIYSDYYVKEGDAYYVISRNHYTGIYEKKPVNLEATDLFDTMIVTSSLADLMTFAVWEYLKVYDFSYEDGVALFEDPDTDDYVRYTVEDGRIVSCEKYSKTIYEGEIYESRLIDEIFYEEVSVTVPSYQ